MCNILSAFHTLFQVINYGIYVAADCLKLSGIIYTCAFEGFSVSSLQPQHSLLSMSRLFRSADLLQLT